MKYLIVFFFASITAKAQADFDKLFNLFHEPQSISEFKADDFNKPFDVTNKHNSCIEKVFVAKNDTLTKLYHQKGAVFYETSDIEQFKSWNLKIPLIEGLKEFEKGTLTSQSFNPDNFLQYTTYLVNDEYFVKMGLFWAKGNKNVYALYIFDKKSCYYLNTASYRGLPRSKM
ncbi:MAG: hypothetical protein MUF45_05150 [Spirosomaceae bacterium]|nr:hypothetical protein [Spirosomataceae bacterium]